MVTFWHLLCHKPFLVATKKVSFAFVQVLWTFPNGSTMADAHTLYYLDYLHFQPSPLSTNLTLPDGGDRKKQSQVTSPKYSTLVPLQRHSKLQHPAKGNVNIRAQSH